MTNVMGNFVFMSLLKGGRKWYILGSENEIDRRILCQHTWRKPIVL